MKALIQHIDKQLDSNKGKNLFHTNSSQQFNFIPDTDKFFESLNDLDPDLENFLVDYITERALEEFCDMNQYYAFDSEAREGLRTIYKNLLSSLKAGDDLVPVSERHYLNLKKWLQHSNPFSKLIYEKAGSKPAVIPCAEYSAQLQIKLLRIDPSTLVEPVLDIGCGKEGILVNYLQKKGISAYGFDRFAGNIKGCSRSDWFSFDFGKNKWGTIISNLGFSNHFVHHHLREDGDYISYAKKYVEILQSLKTGASFYYAPGLPFIEACLDPIKYEIKKHIVGQTEYSATRIIRLA